jgi:ATP-dependent RNA helicase DDX52/ROK1
MDFFEILRGGTVLKRKFSSEMKITDQSEPKSKVKLNTRISGVSESQISELSSFSDRSLIPDWLQSALLDSKFEEPTTIQKQAVPVICSGVDCIASASTGSGKTLAFIIPILSLLQKPGKEMIRALIIAPTRELASQIVREAENLINNCSKKFRVNLIDNLPDNIKRIDIAVATPLRLVQLLNEGKLSLRDTRMAVFDEADRLLDLGFSQQIDEIISTCMKERDSAQRSFQLCFFSATLPPKIVELAKTAMIEPVTVSVGQSGAACTNIEQRLVFAGSEEGKIISFKQLVVNGELRAPALVFVNSKERAQQLCAELVMRGVLADSIHAGRTKAERDRCVEAFREGKIWVLVATDLLARGLDFRAVEMVINFDIPTTAVNYIHRIGRTGRAGRKGLAVTFFTANDRAHLRTVANVIRNSGQEVPEWMTKLPRRPTLKRHLDQRRVEKKARKASVETS